MPPITASMDSRRKAGKVPHGAGPFSPSHPQMVPGEQVEDLLLAAGDGGESFHNGTGCLPRSLRRRSEEHLQGAGGKAWAQLAASHLSPGPQRDRQLPPTPGKPSGHLASKGLRQKSRASTRPDCQTGKGCQGAFLTESLRRVMWRAHPR